MSLGERMIIALFIFVLGITLIVCAVKLNNLENEANFVKNYCTDKREAAEIIWGKKILEDDCHCVTTIKLMGEETRECSYELIRLEGDDTKALNTKKEVNDGK